MMRKIVQIATIVERDHPAADMVSLIALCDDGTLWSGMHNPERPIWSLIPNVPQDTPEAENV